MSHTKTVVVELAKLAGMLAAAGGHHVLNALVPSAAERRAHAFMVPPFDNAGSTGTDGVGGPVVPAQEVPCASPNTTGPIEPRLLADSLFPSGQPTDEFDEPVGEYPDVDPRVVITGRGRLWLIGGAVNGRTGVVLPRSSAGHSQFPADTVPGSCQPPGTGSGHPEQLNPIGDHLAFMAGYNAVIETAERLAVNDRRLAEKLPADHPMLPEKLRHSASALEDFARYMRAIAPA